MMLHELKLANKIFPVNLIQAPLAGYTNSAMRFLVKKYGRAAFSCSEMISCNALAHNSKATITQYLEKNPSEGAVSMQLFGSEPNDLAIATKMLTDFGADLIDFNCGCPVKKVRSQNAGSSLLTEPILLAKLIQTMRNNTHLPISIKIRVAGNSINKFNAELVKVINDSGLDFLVVHGRHWNEAYNAAVHYDQIQYFVDELKIPVIGNGNVADKDSLQKMLATGCAGVMIGRAGIGQPWISKKLIAELNGENFIAPNLAAIGKIFLEHVNLLMQLFNSEKFAIMHIRKMTKQYTRGFKNNKDFCMAVNLCDNLENLEKICSNFFT